MTERIKELRRKPINDLTPEEIGELHDYNENFNGKTANFGKLRLYDEIKDGLIGFMESCDKVRQLQEFPPSPDKQNAVVYVDLDPVSVLSREQAAILGSLMAKSDKTALTVTESCLRVSFTVEVVWSDE